MAVAARPGVLIVDDKEDNLVSLEAALGDLDLDVVRARSGRDALRCLLTRDFAAILLDVNMPGMDGFETAALIRQRKSSEVTPILFITAYADEMHVARGYGHGAVDYIQTPVLPAVLRSKVSVFVDLFRKNAEIRAQAKKLAQRADQLAALAAELTQVEQRERRRLAQVLHDDLQQLLASARWRLGALPRDGEPQPGEIAQVDDLIREAIEASRLLTVELSPPILYDSGLVAALEWHARNVRERHAVDVEIKVVGEPDFSADDHRAFAFGAVQELLFNVCKHAGVAAASVTLDRNADGVEITVEDRGAGFDVEALESRRGGPEHFGLFSLRERVRLMNGRLDVHSRVGEGTRVSLFLPDRSPPRTSRPAPASVEWREPSSVDAFAEADAIANCIRVALVDDHPVVRLGLALLLDNQPDIAVVGQAADGLAAIEMAASVRPDVVIMDVSMPGMNGLEATRRITTDVPGVQVIALSMHNHPHMATAMREAGASAYLTKGGPPDALLAAIRGTRSNVATLSGNVATA